MTETRYLGKMTDSGCRDLTGAMPARRYQIIVSGRLGAVCREAFRDLQIEPHGTDTALTGDLNRSGLHDVLILIRDLALDLVGLTCLAPEPDAKHRARAEPSRGGAAHVGLREAVPFS